MSEITTNLTQSSTIVGSVSQGNQPQVVRVTTSSNANAGSMTDSQQAEVVRVSVPGPQGPQGTAGSSANNIAQASDVDTTTFGLNDGSILQYRAATQKFVARTEFDTTTGTIVLNGGSF